MAIDNFEPFRGLALSREQDAEIREYIAQRLTRGEPWDTLGFSCMLKDMLAPPEPEEAGDGDQPNSSNFKWSRK